jgi:glycosyltransferase involved in cell wall biosynthesis
MKKTLSLCLIAKDAEKTIRGCLKSIEDIVDEIVVVDTGSTDHTKKIAEEFNARIYDYEWNENFSDVRNFSISKVETDWILILDTDEVFVGKKDQIDEFMNKDYRNKTPMYFVDIFTYIKSSPKEDYTYFQKKIRLFPKHDNFLFEFSINEEVTHPQGTDDLLGLTAKGIAIKHFLENGPKSKSKRNVLILKKELKKNPKDFYYNYLMGKECLQHGFLAKAFSSYQNALSSDDEKDEIYLSEICTDVIKILYRQGNPEEALNECIRRQKLCKDNPEYWLTYGYLALRHGDLACARDCLETCLKLTPPAHSLTINIDNITWKPELLLGYTYLRLKDFRNSKIYLEKSLEHNQNQWLLLFYLGITCKNLKDFSASEAYFKAAEIIVPEEYRQDLKFSILLMLIMSGSFEKANDIVKSLVDEFDFDQEDELSLIDYDAFDEMS